MKTPVEAFKLAARPVQIQLGQYNEGTEGVALHISESKIFPTGS